VSSGTCLAQGKRSGDIRSCKWAIVADGTLIALLFTAVCVPSCDSNEQQNKAMLHPSAKIICGPHYEVGQVLQTVMDLWQNGLFHLKIVSVVSLQINWH